MGYDLTAVNKDLDGFHFGAFSWPVLLEACGYLFPYVSQGARYWYHGPDGDPYVTEKNPHGSQCLGSNDGLKVTAADAKLMARCARNFAGINHPDSWKSAIANGTVPPVEQWEVTEDKNRSWESTDPRPWPGRDDFIDKIRDFAEWAEKSRGFWIW
jgi:hypothetical protein